MPSLNRLVVETQWIGEDSGILNRMTFLTKNPFLAFGVALVLLGVLFLVVSHFGTKDVSDSSAQVSDTAYAYEGDMKFEIADTPAKHQKGLSGRADIPDGYGMLFVFDTPQRQGFWMKDMLVPIDIVWLTDTGVIVGIEHSVSPETYPDVFYPPQPISRVLETRAGFAKEKGWDVGQSILLPNP